jgi:type I restriction enzyme S subunit
MWLKSGDIYVERANTPEYVGLAGLYEGPDDFAIYPDLMVRVRVKTDQVVPKYLAEYLLTAPCRRYYQSNAKATAGNFPKIDQGVIEATAVPLPPLEDQEEIAQSLRQIDHKIKAETIRRNALEVLFRTLLHHLMTAKVRVNELEFLAMKEGSP